MIGENTPIIKGEPLGVYYDRWPSSIVKGIDAALNGHSIANIQQILDRGSE